jgi:hypothetical protein
MYRAVAVGRLRNNFALLGLPLDKFSDGEIEAGITRISSCGVSTQDAETALTRFAITTGINYFQR